MKAKRLLGVNTTESQNWEQIGNIFRDGIKFLEQTEAPAFSLQFSPFQTLLFFITFLAIKFFRPNVDVVLFD